MVHCSENFNTYCVDSREIIEKKTHNFVLGISHTLYNCSWLILFYGSEIVTTAVVMIPGSIVITEKLSVAYLVKIWSTFFFGVIQKFVTMYAKFLHHLTTFLYPASHESSSYTRNATYRKFILILYSYTCRRFPRDLRHQNFRKFFFRRTPWFRLRCYVTLSIGNIVSVRAIKWSWVHWRYSSAYS